MGGPVCLQYLWGSIVAAVFAVVVQTQVLAADVAQTFRIGRRGSVSGYDFFLSFALLGIGHLVGLSVGIAMLIGALIGWGWGVPHFSAMSGDITTARRDARAKNLEHKGPLRWCWRDRRFGDLDASQTR